MMTGFWAEPWLNCVLSVGSNAVSLRPSRPGANCEVSAVGSSARHDHRRGAAGAKGLGLASDMRASAERSVTGRDEDRRSREERGSEGEHAGLEESSPARSAARRCATTDRERRGSATTGVEKRVRSWTSQRAKRGRGERIEAVEDRKRWTATHLLRSRRR